ncbi:phage tail assembly protein [Opitutaceae bacterium TAV4]|nr:phage tail assembly protein [Opitutaceae bacterium TAV4]RRK00810.1 phage tail assembly protein [Opitutaceae bacterium TAV3]
MTTIKLQHPFKKADGTQCAEVTLRRPLVRDIRIMHNSGGTDFDKGSRLAANLAELSPDDIDRMDAADFSEIERTVQGFVSPRATN